MELPFILERKGVGYLTKEKDSFSAVYLKVREKELRILTDSEVRKLPKADVDNPNYHEWILRQTTADRFLEYLKNEPDHLRILDLGCGNGWFTHKMFARSKNSMVIGLDVNPHELEQAVRVFKGDGLQFVYGDIFELGKPLKSRFDLVTLNAAIQYFDNFAKLFDILKSFLGPDGEIHILDSPFYKKSDIAKARERTRKYYQDLGFPKMAENYFHHSFDDIKSFDFLYRPKSRLLSKVMRTNASPFPWLRYRKDSANSGTIASVNSGL